MTRMRPMRKQTWLSFFQARINLFYMKHIKVKKTHLYIAPKRKLWNFLSY